MNCFSLLLLVCPITLPTGDDATGDLRRFQGTWQAIAIQNLDGSSATAADLMSTRLDVDGNRFLLKSMHATIVGRFVLDSSKTPKTIDVILDHKEGETPVKVLGIYKIEGEIRKSCFAMPEKERPRDFPAVPSGYLQLEWKRQISEPGPRK